MKQTIVAMILALILTLPLGIADRSFIYFPATSSSPMVPVYTPLGRYINTQNLNTIRQGLPVIVYGQPPQGEGSADEMPQSALMIDEYGVLVDRMGNPVIRGTTGHIFAVGYDWTKVYPWNRYGNYFTNNLRGFKASIAETQWIQHGGRTWDQYMVGGYGPAQAVIKQWYRPRDNTAGYIVPGVTNMITSEPQYVRPGIPSYVAPSATTEEETGPLTSSTAKIVARNTIVTPPVIVTETVTTQVSTDNQSEESEDDLLID